LSELADLCRDGIREYEKAAEEEQEADDRAMCYDTPYAF
jgi:hypothetical protein